MLLSVTVSPLCDFMHFLKLCDCPIRKYIQETFLLAWEPRVLCSFLQKVCVGTALLTTMKQLEVWLLSIAHSNSLFITQIPFCAICNFFSITYASYILGWISQMDSKLKYLADLSPKSVAVQFSHSLEENSQYSHHRNGWLFCLFPGNWVDECTLKF